MLIGVTGYAQHGKDSIGSFLVEGFEFKRYAFADILKEMALVLNPIVQTYSFPQHPDRLETLVGIFGWNKIKDLAEVRRFLQVFGTEVVRNYLGEDSWVRALQLRLEQDGNPPHVVVTDVRFPNEAQWVHQTGGVLWRVHRTNSDGSPFDNMLGAKHPSEHYIADLPADKELTASNLEELKDRVHIELKERRTP